MKQILMSIALLMLTTIDGYSRNVQVECKSMNIVNTQSAIVDRFIVESIRVYSVNDFSSFFSEEFIMLSQKENLTEEELHRFTKLYDAGFSKMLSSNPNLNSAYNDLKNLNLSKSDFVKNVDLFFSNNPSQRAIIPNKNACARSWGLYSLAVASNGFYPFHLAYIGVLVHC